MPHRCPASLGKDSGLIYKSTQKLGAVEAVPIFLMTTLKVPGVVALSPLTGSTIIDSGDKSGAEATPGLKISGK